MDEDLRLLRQVSYLERAGDAAGALDLVVSTARRPDGTMMWSPSRIMRLLEIDTFGPRLPAWAWARWLRGQALDCLGPPDEGRLRGALDDASLVGPDAADWAVSQSYLYDRDGLSALLRIASPDLVQRASDVGQWPDAGMGAFRLVGDSAATITWLRLDTDEEVETLNLGTAATLRPGDHVIGRRVICGTDALFESPPLAVPETVATAVSRQPGAWLEVLRRREEAIDPLTRSVARIPRTSGILTDLPDRVWEDLAYGVWEVAEEERFHDDSPRYEGPPALDVLSEACIDLVLAAMDDLRRRRSRLWAEPPLRDPWPAVAAALQRPGVSLSLVARMISDGYGPGDLVALGGRLGGFARSMCGVDPVERDVTR